MIDTCTQKASKVREKEEYKIHKETDQGKGKKHEWIDGWEKGRYGKRKKA